jgi:2-hydroxychromene-2-carboxylate isomerase
MVYVSFWIPKELYEEAKKVADELGVSIGELAREVLRERLKEAVKLKSEAKARKVRSSWGAPLVVTSLIGREELLIGVLRFLKNVDPELLERALKRAGVVSEEWKLREEGEEGRREDEREDKEA